ncbi:tetratricopeptide repeat protein [Dysgonomonas sp. ZJ279]|uniref:tetratricopeptide repeat protein n=1 Tax=Dysgonomonas sp. ZJ279 TaxID=2709796 RepID=UPI0013EBF178|nr:tetratricopeptide repeat protein [Dysgonomonas sp. ZJ279]
MKRIILSFLLLSAISWAVSAQSVAEQARETYDNGDYRQTIELLEKEMLTEKEQGRESADLYYNLGNAYFRINEVAKARLYYEKALLLDPGDRDIRHNIDYVSTKIEDKILVADTFFLSTWFTAVQNLLSSNRWATFGIVSFVLFILCLALFFFTKLIVVKKGSFYAGIILILFTIFANIFSFNQKRRIENRDTAIIMAGSASVVSSPDINSKELFILHAGTKVTITKEDRSWLEIEIDNGSIGWIQREKIEII